MVFPQRRGELQLASLYLCSRREVVTIHAVYIHGQGNANTGWSCPDCTKPALASDKEEKQEKLMIGRARAVKPITELDQQGGGRAEPKHRT